MKNEMEIKKLTLFLIFLLLTSWMKVSGQTWTAPEEVKTRVSPFTFAKENIEAGKIIYQKNCQSCHGLPGQNNPAKISPDPGDPASSKYQTQTDGEMFWKITTGKTPMPQFQSVLNDEERWNVISYIRSFNPKYVQPEPETRPGFTGKRVRLSMEYLPEQKKIEVVALEKTENGAFIPSPGIEIVLSAKRYFGQMQIGNPKPTNKSGIVMFDAPADLTGDKEGMIEFMARVNAPEGSSIEGSVKDTIRCGKKNTAPSLIATRAWWSTRDKAPVWVIATYSVSVIIVWGFIFYIIMLLGRMRKLHHPPKSSETKE